MCALSFQTMTGNGFEDILVSHRYIKSIKNGIKMKINILCFQDTILLVKMKAFFTEYTHQLRIILYEFVKLIHIFYKKTHCCSITSQYSQPMPSCLRVSGIFPHVLERNTAIIKFTSMEMYCVT